MMKSLSSWINERFPWASTWKNYASEYPVPRNLNVFYYFGVFALVVVINQIVTGLWLTLFYTPTADLAFSSVQSIMREVKFGWLIRSMHTTGASFFFIVLYLHLFKALLYGSYQKPRELVWFLGLGLLLIAFAEAISGYLLPWGQLSYWGAEVMTSLLGIIPGLGKSLVIWVRGDYSVSGVTLQRFFALHVAGLPLLMMLLIALHLVALHHVGSNNPLGIDVKKKLSSPDCVPFHPYYTSKDAYGTVIFLIIFFAVVFFAPNFGGYFVEPNNLIPADSLVTPDLITPVWYLTPFYAMLRAIPDKMEGVILVGMSFFLLFLLPWLDRSPVRSLRYKGELSKTALIGLVLAFIVLGFLGHREVSFWSLRVARVALGVYFAYFLLMPIYTRLESCRPPPSSIGEGCED